jgi:hypothetical protein
MAQECWDPDPAKRPAFENISLLLRVMLFGEKARVKAQGVPRPKVAAGQLAVPAKGEALKGVVAAEQLSGSHLSSEHQQHHLVSAQQPQQQQQQEQEGQSDTPLVSRGALSQFDEQQQQQQQYQGELQSSLVAQQDAGEVQDCTGTKSAATSAGWAQKEGNAFGPSGMKQGEGVLQPGNDKFYCSKLQPLSNVWRHAHT